MSRWDRVDWTPPKLVLSNFHKPDKICQELHPIEAEFYIGIPIKRMISAMLEAFVVEGGMGVRETSPLKVKIIKEPDFTQLDDYEQLFYESLADNGEFSQEKLEAFMNLAVKYLQEKAWDGDVEETKTYYAQLIDDYIDEREQASPIQGRAVKF